MSQTSSKHKVEFIESYWTGGEYGSNYEWSDNHGELVRCKDCKNAEILSWLDNAIICKKHSYTGVRPDEFYCADAERRGTND